MRGGNLCLSYGGVLKEVTILIPCVDCPRGTVRHDTERVRDLPARVTAHATTPASCGYNATQCMLHVCIMMHHCTVEYSSDVVVACVCLSFRPGSRRRLGTFISPWPQGPSSVSQPCSGTGANTAAGAGSGIRDPSKVYPLRRWASHLAALNGRKHQQLRQHCRHHSSSRHGPYPH